jgi:hypothetical protein
MPQLGLTYSCNSMYMTADCTKSMLSFLHDGGVRSCDHVEVLLALVSACQKL